MKLLLTTFLFFWLSPVLFAQKGTKDTLTAEQTKDLLNQIFPNDNGFLNTAAENSCKCIAKIKIKNKSQEEISQSVSKCIQKESDTYSLMVQMMASLKNDSGKGKNIIYAGDGKTHDKYYFEIERRLRDSCSALNFIIGAENKESENSMSSDKKALAYYKKGQTAMDAEIWDDAISYFRKALNEDPGFSFGWDNLGVCLRKNGNTLEAIEAYSRSLEIDPKGETALQNLPVAYAILKDYDKAIEGYQKLIKVYPDNPEGYYGVGKTYLDGKNDAEKALDYMCKAYVIYLKMGSPYRTDSESIISGIYSLMKKDGKKEIFEKILKENNINPNFTD